MGIFSKLFGRSDKSDVRDCTYTGVPDDYASADTFCCPADADACFAVSDVFTISGKGTVVTGTVTKGSFSVGDMVTIKSTNSTTTVISGIEQFRKTLDTIHTGDNAGLLLMDVTRKQVARDCLIIK